jgi:large repetitive protein
LAERSKRRSTIASATAVSLVVGTVVALSLTYDGVATADVSLNDGGVWVTGTADTRIGRLNYPIEEVDAQLAAATATFDILQDASDVLIVDDGLGRVDRIDTAAVAGAGGAALPSSRQIDLGGGTVSVLDSGTGDLRVVTVDTLSALEDEEVEATLRVGVRSVIDVDGEGTTWIFDPATRVVTAVTREDADLLALIARGDDAEGSDEEGGESTDASASAEDTATDGALAATGDDVAVEDLEPPELATYDLTESILDPDGLDTADLAITAIGTDPVVMISRTIRVDDSNRPQVEIVQPDRDPILLSDVASELGVELDAEEVALQATSAERPDVTIATRDALLRIPLEGGEARITKAESPGTPATPVVVNGCAFGAWSADAASAMRFCNDAGVPMAVDGAGADAQLAFRVNRDYVVLNNMATGAVWMIENQLIPVQDWLDTSPPPNSQQEEEDSHDTVEEDVPLDRDQPNRAPTAADDDLGVRPGTTRILPLLDNDADPDGDLLTILPPADFPEAFGTPQLVMGGRALQVVVPEDASGTATFTYTADDGRGLTDDALVTLRAVPLGENSAPEVIRDVTLRVASGASVTRNVFADIRDPDGDELTLSGATVDSEGDSVRTTPDGSVTFSDAGVSTSPKRITLQVFDGYELTPIEIGVEVVAGNQPPRAEFDFATAFVGQTIILTPLENDTDTSGQQPRLAQVQPFGNGQTAPNFADGTIEFTPDQPGPVYATYLIADDEGATGEGLIRVDVKTPVDGDPIAVRDTAMLPPGGEVLVDVLQNDTDPGGGVLAVQQVDVPSGYGLNVAVLEHRLLRITSDRVLAEPVRIGYSIANETGSADGEVLVVPLRADTQPQPPVAVKDVVSVRAGDYVTIPVLSNDHHPNGLEFTLDETLTQQPEAGLMFATQNVLRYQAPTDPGQQTAIYSVTDVNGQQNSAQVVIEVKASDGNAAPVPVDVDTRAFQRELIRIPINLVGIDPDGDSVQLLGLGSAPELGQVTEIGTDYIDYVPYNTAVGTDTFDFLVRDRPGQIATGTVKVGIVPPPAINRNPVVPAVEAHHRPERTVTVNVLEEATDPDGDQLAVSRVTDTGGLAVEVTQDSQLQISTPVESGTFPIGFEVTDGNGGVAVSTLVLEVSPQAPLHTPVAVDDLVPVSDIIGSDSALVQVLANDYDPDGDASDLVLGLTGDQPTASIETVDGAQQVRVALTPTRQVVTYQITDLDGLTTYAFIDVPGTEDSGPALRSGFTQLEVMTGETLEIELNDHIVAVSGDPVQVTDPSKARATNSDGTPPVTGPSTVTFTSAAGYVGLASVTLEVTDAADLNDPERKVSVITIPINVTANGNTPPTISSTEINVEAGQSEPQVIRLQTLADDVDGADRPDLRFELLGQPEGFTAELVNLTELHVTAALDTQKGTRGEFQVSVSDGVNEPVVGTMVANAVASSAAPAVAVDDDLGEIQQGQSASIDVLGNDSNPFPGQPLTLVGAEIETGAAQVGTSGGSVTVTPAGDFVGRLTIVYTIGDATQDPDRQVQARVRANVIGVPAAPSAPRVEAVGNREVTVSFTTPIDNGAPITGYSVQWAGGSQACASTTCVIAGLTNNVEYTFTVTAENKVGVGPASASSAVARPDVKPGAPGAPTLTFGDSKIDVAWSTPANEGSPIIDYDVQISPATGGGQQSVGTQTAYTWGSLQNGTAYTFRVRARNSAPDPGDWSAWSAPETPAAPPDTPQAPRATRVDTPIGGQIQVAWQAPANNGDALRDYVLTPIRGGAAQPAITLPPGQTSYTYAAENGQDYTFTVSTSNKAGPSGTSPASSSVRSFGQPAQVGGTTAAPTGQNGQIVVTHGTPSDNGQAISRFEYALNGGGYQALPGNKTIGGLSNGSSYTVQVRACNTYCGPASAASSAAVPYGPPLAFTPTGTANGQTVTFSWDARSASNGATISEVRYQIDGGNTKSSPGPTGSDSVGGNWEQNHTIEVWAVNQHGQEGPRRSVTVKAEPDPTPPEPPTVWITKGRQITCQSDGQFGCWTLVVNWSGMTSSHDLVVGFESNGACDFSRTGYSLTIRGATGSQELSRGNPPPHRGTCDGDFRVTDVPGTFDNPWRSWR